MNKIKGKRMEKGYAWPNASFISGLKRYQSIIIEIIVPIGKPSNPIIANIIATVLAHGCRFHNPYAIAKQLKKAI